MIRAYDKTYLPGAMQNMGVMMDYAVNFCGMAPDDYYARFLGSSVAVKIASGHPRYLVGLSGAELAARVIEESGGFPTASGEYCSFGRSAEFWAGWALADLQWYYAMDFRTMASFGIDIELLLQWYPTLHEADISKAESLAGEILSRRKIPVFKTIRKAAGFTQEELSRRSGVSLRMIRAYEQGAQPVRKAEYLSVERMARVLGCRPTDFV